MIPTLEDINKAADKFVECGFATRFLVTKHQSLCDLTPEGKSLCEGVQRLFGVPQRSMYDVKQSEIMAMMGLILSQSRRAPNG